MPFFRSDSETRLEYARAKTLSHGSLRTCQLRLSLLVVVVDRCAPSEIAVRTLAVPPLIQLSYHLTPEGCEAYALVVRPSDLLQVISRTGAEKQ